MFCLQASERLNIDDFLVGESYDGPCLDHDGKITESFIESIHGVCFMVDSKKVKMLLIHFKIKSSETEIIPSGEDIYTQKVSK